MEMLQEPADGFRIVDEGDHSKAAATVGTRQGVYFAGRHVCGFPDWRAIAVHAERITQSRRLLLANEDHWACLNFYLIRSDKVYNHEWISVYPEDFWLLVLYLPWNADTQGQVADLRQRSTEAERIEVDRFAMFVRFRVR